jgi:hypothetical protein
MSGMTEGEKACGEKREKEKVRRKNLGVNGRRIFLPLRLTPYDIFPSYLLSVPDNIDVVGVKQSLHVAGTNKLDLGVRGNVGREVQGLGDLAGVGAVHVIGLKGGPRCSPVV